MSEADNSMNSGDKGSTQKNENHQDAAATLVAKVVELSLKFDMKHPHANILIAGKTGVGKSTLINTVFRGEMAETGIGRPVTKEIQEITKPGVPLTIIDTKGLELADFKPIRNDILRYIDERNGEDASTYVHIAWLCISDGSARIEDAELELAKALKAAGLEVIVVLTKVSRFKDNAFEAVVREQFRGITSDIVLTRGLSEDVLDDEDRVIGLQTVRGIDQLLNLSYLSLPKAQRYSFANAASISHKKAQELKRQEADTAINYFCAAAGVVGASPIPFSDAALLAPIQGGMIIKISQVYGMDVSLQDAPQMLTSLAGGTGAVSMIGKTIVTNLIKFIPGGGSVVGGAIAATTAVALTKLLGSQYAAGLAELSDHGQEVTLDAAIAALRRKMPI